MTYWNTIPEIADLLGKTVDQVESALRMLDLTESRAHSLEQDGARRYSPSVVCLVELEIRAAEREAAALGR